MIYIAHRALFDGYNERRENHPDQIDLALAAGFDVEIDVRLIDGEWWLGHDEPTYKIDSNYLEQHGMWLHCKNFAALAAMPSLGSPLFPPTYFWHQNDDFTITSTGYIWTYPGKPIDPKRGIINQPEWTKGWTDDIKSMNAAGVCSKFVNAIRSAHNTR